MGDVERVGMRVTEGGALVCAARDRGSSLAELPSKRQDALSDDLVIVKRAGRVLLEGKEGSADDVHGEGMGRMYTSDPDLSGKLMVIRNYTRTPALAPVEERPKLLIESADLGELPDNATIELSGLRHDIDTLGELRKQRWNIQYVVLLDSRTAERLEIPGDADRPCHVNLEPVDDVPRRIMGLKPVDYIDVEVFACPGI